ncbi:DUF3710 domain-containing protein [Staphylococcus chromogenes]|nr:DUF3710 domain-containing protein [Staphylococcus chromogenes]
MWPFGKKTATDQPSEHSEPALEEVSAPERAEANQAHEAEEFGPFDGDSVNVDDYDFSDFSVGTLDLGSMKIAMPQPSEVQVEMGEDGPRMLHIVTQFGRITPVAFAAARSGGVWAESVAEVVKGMEADELEVHTEQGPWGEEVVGTTEHAVIRIFGVDGPRWTLRMTLAAPRDRAADLAQLGREVAARTFVYRGETPMMSGTVLPVVMPSQLVAQVQQAMQERMQEAVAPTPQGGADTADTPQPQPAATPKSRAEGDAGSALEQMKNAGNR